MEQAYQTRLEAVERMIAQMVIRGKVIEINYDTQRARVCYGVNDEGEKQKTPWLRWKPIRAGNMIVWCPLKIGEAVTVLSPGDIELGEILPSSYSGEYPTPSTDPDLYIIQLDDGSVIQHNLKTGDYAATYKGQATITVEKDTTINSTGAININSTAKDIQFNGGAGVVTGECICPYTGNPHADVSQQVKAGK